MKTHSLAATLALACGCLLAAGCATTGAVTHLQPVGPVPAAAEAASTGSLVVYSAFDLNESGPVEPDYRRHHSDYDLYMNGQRVQSVSNRRGPLGTDPARVDLAPGAYEVYALDNRYGWLHIPVVVAAGRRTDVHLDGATWSGPSAPPADPVSLPDGRIVGWKG